MVDWCAGAMTLEREVAAHVRAEHGIGVRRVDTLDVGVFRLHMEEGPHWVARVFTDRCPAATAADAAALRWLESQDFPAERCATPEPVSTLPPSDPPEAARRSVLLTEYVDPVPPPHRREAIKAAGGLLRLGALLGRLHQLSGGPERPGGAWHHAADGLPAREIEAGRRWAPELPWDQVHDGSGLPEAFTHPDFVLANVVATSQPGMVIVDWTGSGRGPRAWSLAFLLWVEGLRDVRRARLVLAGYRRHVRLEPEEIRALPALMQARPMVLAAWGIAHGHRSSADALAGAASAGAAAERIAEAIDDLLQ